MPENSNNLVSLDAPMNPHGCKNPLFGLDVDALSSQLAAFGEPFWRGKQLSEALYQQWITDISAITTLLSYLRSRLLSAGWQVARPVIAQAFQSSDGTERYLIDFPACSPKTETAEAVWMPEGDGGEAG